MTTTDPTAGESYGFPNGEPEEGKPGPLPRRTPGSTTPAALKPGTRVQAILLDENKTDLPGMEGTVIRVGEWPIALPEQWTDENTVIVRWDDPERLRYTPYRPDVAARVLRVLDDEAPTDTPTGAVTTPSPVPVGGALPSLVELDQREALGDLLSSVDDLLANGMDQGYYHDNVREALTAYRKAVSS